MVVRWVEQMVVSLAEYSAGWMASLAVALWD